MNVSREEKKVEAISRMKKLGIFGQTIKQFEKEDYVSISEPPFGAFFWAEGEDLEAIREYEDRYNALVYMVIRSYTGFGIIDSYLYVSDYKEEWQLDRDCLAENRAVAYCRNKTMPDCSEGGYIGFKRTVAAGLQRTW